MYVCTAYTYTPLHTNTGIHMYTHNSQCLSSNSNEVSFSLLLKLQSKTYIHLVRYSVNHHSLSLIMYKVMLSIQHNEGLKSYTDNN